MVRRYGGTVEYTGDGVMAVFGAPVALEDHAFRACLAALAIQDEANAVGRRGAAPRRRDSAVAGRSEFGSGDRRRDRFGIVGLRARSASRSGMAQRMESVAPPGGVMLSESTARLVEHTVTLGEPEWVRIKGADEPVPARRLLAIGPRHRLVGRAEASLVGRRWEMAALDAMVGPRNRRPRRRRQCGGTAGHRQEPGGPGGRRTGGRSRGRGVLDLLRIARRATSRSMW